MCHTQCCNITSNTFKNHWKCTVCIIAINAHLCLTNIFTTHLCHQYFRSTSTKQQIFTNVFLFTFHIHHHTVAQFNSVPSSQQNITISNSIFGILSFCSPMIFCSPDDLCYWSLVLVSIIISYSQPRWQRNIAEHSICIFV